MKTTNRFKQTIEQHLKFVAFSDPLFAKTLEKPNKNIDDCVSYILDTVQKSGCQGFEDEEIFKMAIHYYDEDDIKPAKNSSRPNVIVNHKVRLTIEEKEAAKKEARDRVIKEEMDRMRKKPDKNKAVTPDKKAGDKSEEPATLF